MGKGRIKRILRLCRFEFFDKGEGRHKKNSGDQSLANSFWQREKRMKRMNSTSFQGLENQKAFGTKKKKKFKEITRDSRLVKNCMSFF